MAAINYTPEELNNLLLDETKTIASNFCNISVTGDIKECKLWKRSGMGFKIFNGKSSIECNAWNKDGNNPETIKDECENTNCKVFGRLEAGFFYSHKFVLRVMSIEENKDTETELNKIKKECEIKGYFENKKLVDFKSVKTLGIISKKNTQGYNDFIEQFCLPVNIILEEIPLEGERTSEKTITAINNLQEKVDLIMIIRGGGSTSEISKSYDKIILFEAIKKSKKPIVTAIGHENDRGDKLLITEVSDYDFPTPSTAVLSFVKIFTSRALGRLNSISDEMTHIFNSSMLENKTKEYLKLQDLFEKKVGGKIVEVGEVQDHIIIQKGNKFYKTLIDYSQEIEINENDMTAIRERNIKKITSSDMDEGVEKIKDLEKIEADYDSAEAKKIDELWLKIPFPDGSTDIKKLPDMKSIILLYEQILKGEGGENIKEIIRVLTW